MKEALNKCFAELTGKPFLTLFAPYASPLDLLTAYALFCRNKANEAFALLESFGIEKHVLLDISSLHLMLRHIHYLGDRRLLSNDIPEDLVMPALIPARGNSKGIPQKNLAMLNGKSLLEIAAAKAKKSRFITRVIVDTDSVAIAQAARKAGAEVLYLRPEILARDFSDLTDVKVLATHWLELMEGYWYDYLAVLTPPHPLWPTSELDKACEAFIRSSHTSLVSVTPTEFRWNAYYSFRGGRVECVARRKSGELFARNGAFSLFSRKPNAHYSSSTYRKIYPTEFKTMVFPLSKMHGIDINTPEELYICGKIYQMKSNVSTMTSNQCRTYLEENGAVLPVSENGPAMILHYQDIGEEYALDGVPSFMKLLATLADTSFAGRYLVCGESRTAKSVAEYFDLPLIFGKTVLKRNGALTIRCRKTVGDGEIVYINGYAGGIKPETIAHVVKTIRTDECAFCTTLRHVDSPPQWIFEKKGDDVSALLNKFVGFRQKIEDTYVESQMLAGFGSRANHDRPFTDYLMLNPKESTPFISPLNLIVASSLT